MGKKNEPIQVSFLEIKSIEGKRLLVEQCYKEGEGVVFAVWDGQKIKYETTLIIDEINYTPIWGDDVSKKLILLPECAEAYENEEQLVNDIKKFLEEWLGVSEDYYNIATYYILMTWVYEKFDTINYLRALGDTGSGKSRFLDVIGALCYKFIQISGAVTPAPVFRLLEKWKGTLGIEEGDLKESDETNEIIKILNCGFEKGKPVVRCDKNFPDKINTFEVFGPKVIATRKEFHDQATEARCLTEIMMQDNSKPDTKTKKFYETRTKLRNKLLMFRFRNYDKVNIEKALEINLDELEPRLRQVSRGFLALVWNNESLLGKFKAFLKEYNRNLIELRSQTWEGLVINNIAENLAENKKNITCSQISDELGIDKLTNRKVGSILNRLNLKIVPAKVEGKTKKVLNLNYTILNILFDRYIADTELKEKAKNFGNLVSNFGNLVSYIKPSPVTEVTVTMDTTKFKIKKEDDKGQLEEKKDRIAFNDTKQDKIKMSKSDALHYNGNLGNSVTKTNPPIQTQTGKFEKIPPIFQACSSCGDKPILGLPFVNLVDESLWCKVCASFE